MFVPDAVARVFRRGDFPCNWQSNPRPGKTGTSYNFAAGRQVAERIRDRLKVDQEIPRISLSIGTATFPQRGNSAQQLLESADRALYTMKEQTKRGKAQKHRQ